MQLHEVRSASLSSRKKVRVGRGMGSGIGKTSGRGREGATSRSGYAMKVTYEGGQMPLFRRLPKRGFTNGPFKVEYATVNVGDLAGFAAGSQVGPDELRQKGLLPGRKNMPVKILGDGELVVSLTVAADRFSKSAAEKIAKAGGKVEWLAGQPKKSAPLFTRVLKDKKLLEAYEAAKKETAKPKGEEGAAKPAAKEAAKEAKKPAAPKKPAAEPEKGA